jgi:iron complex outermembrane receptor protein
MRKRKIDVGRTVAIGLALGAMIAADVALAEQAELEEIVVTARKRAENLQEVATSINALDPSSLSKRFDTDLRDFANAAPNVVIDDLGQGPGSPAAIAIRGVGTTDVEKSFDPTAGVVVDGIFIGVNSGAMIKSIDIQSIELLNGPQGTLFGRNSIAGVLNITRSKPSTEEVFGQARIGYGNYDDTEIDGYVNLPVSDKFAFKIGVAKRSHDGYFYDATTKKNVGAEDYKSLSPSFLWKPMEGLELTYRYDQTWQTQDTDVQDNMAQPGQVWCFYYHQCAQSLTSPQAGNRYVVLGEDAPTPAFFNTQMHNLGVVWDMGSGYKINYLFGYFKTAEDANQDWDATPLTLYETLRPARYYQHSNELRLSYAGAGPLSYTVGLYEWNSGYRIDLNSSIGFGDFLYGLPAGTVLTVLQTVQQKTDSYAGFFEGDYKFSDQWTLTLGGRYTDDKKSSGLIDPTMPQLATKGNLDNPFTDSWKQFTPKASVKYQFTPDVMVYGLYSQGFRAGGFDGRPGTYDAASKPYNPEKVDNFEVGWKSELFEHRLRINGSIFVMKYKDKQEEESVPTTVGTGQETLVINASSATIKGAEIDAVASIAPGFTLSGNIGYLNARYDKLADPVTGANLSYLHLRRSPPMTATISPNYEWTLGPGRASIQADYHYIGAEELTFLNSPQSRNPHQNLLNASVNYTFNKTRISAYGLNLTKDDAWEQAYDVGSSTSFAGLWTYATPRPPLTYGMRITQSF